MSHLTTSFDRYTFLPIFALILLCVILPVVHLSSSFSPNVSSQAPATLSEDVKEGCQSLLEQFATTVGLFTFCAVKNARPIRVCEKCITIYLDVLTAHDAILQLYDHSGQACKLELINLDRLEIIESTFQNVKDLWTKGNCDTCFVTENGKLTSQLSNNTLEFQGLFENNEACFQLFVNDTQKNITADVCDVCKDIYCKMNEFYNNIKEEVGDGGICIDVVDSMNSTRTTWSQEFGCTLNSMRFDLPFILAACLVSLTPVVFYVTAKLFSIKAETRLLHQSRYLVPQSVPSTSHATS